MNINRLPDRELQVMQAIWKENKEVHTGEIAQNLRSEKPIKLQALQVLLTRLADKGFLSCKKLGRLNYYKALILQEDYNSSETHLFLERLYRNSPKSLIMSLIKDHGVTKEDIDEIKKLLEEE